MDGAISSTDHICNINNPAEQTLNTNTATVPLLLHPLYSRTKSITNDELMHFRISLKWCALDHSSLAGKITSLIAFLAFALIVPAAVSLSHNSTANKLVQIPESLLAAISFLTLASFFNRYGLRQILFLDGLLEDLSSVRRGYVRELDRAFKYLTYILLPSFLVEIAHKTIFFSGSAPVHVPYVSAKFPCNAVVFVASLVSWVYRTGVFLLVCVLFRLTCELQILRFEGFRKMLEGFGSDAGAMFKEHVRIKRQLLVTSHRYRIFILGCLVTISFSQLGALLFVLGSQYDKNFRNSGDLVVCSAVQLSGFFLCLIGAAKITHRAQGIVSIATQWHLTMTCTSDGKSKLRSPSSKKKQKKVVVTIAPPPPPVDSSDRPKSSETGAVAVDLPAQQEDHHLAIESRKALVAYLQHNSGGITLFGFALDRGLLHTLFAFEMSLVLWILSKVVVL